LLIQAGPLTGVIFSCGPADTSYAAESADALTGALVQLIKALAYSPAGTEELVVISQGAHAVGRDSGAFSPAGAAVWGAMRCVPFENPALRHRCIDLDPGATDQVKLVTTEIRAGDEMQVAIRHGQRFVRRLAPVARVQAGLPQLAADGWYLITGGLGGLGLSLASWLSGQGARKLALVGRRAPSLQAAERIREIQRAGVEVVTGKADVGDQNVMAALLDELRVRLGPLRGVIHAAGVLNDGALLEMEPRAITEVMRPKTYGVQNMHRLTLSDQLDWFVVFSSAASVVGSPGQANYCAANAFLDTFVQYQRANGIAASSINWGPWAEAGMAASVLL
jgi:NADP-dependent 3-hydroxy acid dehydrogenase YdfG